MHIVPALLTVCPFIRLPVYVYSFVGCFVCVYVCALVCHICWFFSLSTCFVFRVHLIKVTETDNKWVCMCVCLQALDLDRFGEWLCSSISYMENVMNWGFWERKWFQRCFYICLHLIWKRVKEQLWLQRFSIYWNAHSIVNECENFKPWAARCVNMNVLMCGGTLNGRKLFLYTLLSNTC